MQYLHLGASTDGLILDDSTINVKGIIDMKCLKIFIGKFNEQIIQQKLPELSRPCFKVVDNKILLLLLLHTLTIIRSSCNFWLLKPNIAILFCIQILGKYIYREYLRIKNFNTELLKLQKYFREGF